jgi:hypothetical protein
MDFEDILKDTFNKLLEESRAERGLVIEAFMRAYEKVQRAESIERGIRKGL